MRDGSDDYQVNDAAGTVIAYGRLTVPGDFDSPFEEGELSEDGQMIVALRQLTPEEKAAREAQAAREDARAKWDAVAAAVATLRQWADDAEATTVTSGNAVATLQTVVARLGVFFDRFADLVESDRL